MTEKMRLKSFLFVVGYDFFYSSSRSYPMFCLISMPGITDKLMEDFPAIVSEILNLPQNFARWNR